MEGVRTAGTYGACGIPATDSESRDFLLRTAPPARNPAVPNDPRSVETTDPTGDSPSTDEILDTRDSDSPWGRVYASPFARVWDALHEEIRSRRHWSLVHSDEELGLLTATCRSWHPWEVSHLTVWVRLDENALTRVDTRAWCRSGWGLPGGNRRRVRALVSRLDKRLGESMRVEI